MASVCDLCGKDEGYESGLHDVKMSRTYHNIMYCGACRMGHSDGIQPGKATERWLAALEREGHKPGPPNTLGLYNLERQAKRV